MRAFFCLFLVPAVLSLSLSTDDLECKKCINLAGKSYSWNHEMMPPRHLEQAANDGSCETECLSGSGNPDADHDCSFTCSRLSYVSSIVSGSARDVCVSVGHCRPVGQEDPEYHVPLVSTNSTYVPIVLMHGITSNASSMDLLASWITEKYPGIYVKNVEIGDGWSSSFLMSLSSQISNLCKQIKGDENLRNGFDLLGFSQGTALTRGYIERCNNPQVRHYISLAGVHGGIFGEGIIPSVVSKQFHAIPYDFFVQHMFSFAQMWKDPFNLGEYLSKNIFMPDINNELPKKKLSYKLNMASLKKAIAMYSAQDNVIRPQPAGWFEFYAAGQNKDVVPLENSPTYQEDWIGLKTLDQSNRLVRVETDCLHVEHVGMECYDFIEKLILPWIGLRND